MNNLNCANDILVISNKLFRGKVQRNFFIEYYTYKNLVIYCHNILVSSSTLIIALIGMMLNLY